MTAPDIQESEETDAPQSLILHVSDDGLQVVAIRFEEGERVDLDPVEVRAALEEMGVEIDEDELRTGIRASSDGVVAKGRPARPGRSTEVDWKVAVALRGGLLRWNGTMDFRARNQEASMVDVATLIGRIVVGEEGKAGVNVWGEPIEVEDVDLAWITPGDGVEQRGELLFSSREGRVRVSRTDVQVEPTVEIRGDVDFSTGHINSRSLGVLIRGGVCPGFQVVAGGMVEIGQAVEDGEIRSGDDVVIRGGLIGREQGLVSCRGAFSARFVHSARIDAIGDVTVPDGITQGRVRTMGRVDVTGRRGSVVGGQVIAAGGIVCRQAGSPLGTATRLVVSNRMEDRRLLRDVRSLRDQRMQELVKTVGERICSWRLDEVPPEHAEDYAEYRQLEHGLKRLERLQQERATDQTKAKVQILDWVYPGVIVSIGKKDFVVRTALKGAVFAWNNESDRVEVLGGIEAPR